MQAKHRRVHAREITHLRQVRAVFSKVLARVVLTFVYFFWFIEEEKYRKAAGRLARSRRGMAMCVHAYVWDAGVPMHWCMQ